MKIWTAREIAFKWNSSYINNKNDVTRNGLSKIEFISVSELEKTIDDFEKKWYLLFDKHYGKGYISCKHEKKLTNDIIIIWKQLKSKLKAEVKG